jgi:hypothetical protein
MNTTTYEPTSEQSSQVDRSRHNASAYDESNVTSDELLVDRLIVGDASVDGKILVVGVGFGCACFVEVVFECVVALVVVDDEKSTLDVIIDDDADDPSSVFVVNGNVLAVVIVVRVVVCVGVVVVSVVVAHGCDAGQLLILNVSQVPK